MKKILLLLSLFIVAIMSAKAGSMPVDTGKVGTSDDPKDPPLILFGSVDTYWKDDFSGKANIPTSFGNEQNSVSIGFVDLGIKKKVGKAAFVGELSFGPRSDQSIPTSGYHIQNLYVSYDVTDKFNLSAGYMSTFVGY